MDQTSSDLQFTSVYSGKLLSEVPFDHLWADMPVIDDDDGEGKIVNVIKRDQYGMPVKAVKITCFEPKAEGVVEITYTAIHSELKFVRVK
jgi:hypothetical protein